MEASALHAPHIGRLGLSSPLLRLRSDEQLVALFRAGSEDAFAVIHDRYRQRLFAYVRQMLSSTSRSDAEDVLQDVFVRAYSALRNDGREINLRAWLYRVAHNRCIDHLRRPTPAASEVFEMSRTPLQDPIETAQRRDDLRRLVEDVGRLPEQQRSALLMREIDGLAYADIAAALDVTVPAVKSLLVRARIGLVEAIEARDADCAVIRADLAAAYDRGVKASGRARRHMRECDGCREYRGALRGVRKSFAAINPAVAAGPLALVAKALGFGGGGAAAGGGAAVGGGATAAGTGAAAAACKVAAVVCTAAVATGGAVQAERIVHRDKAARTPAAVTAAPAAVQQAARATTPAAAAVTAEIIRRRTDPGAPRAAVAPERAPRDDRAALTPIVVTGAPAVPVTTDPLEEVRKTTGGAVAPVDTSIVDGGSGTSQGSTGSGTQSGTGTSGGSQPPAEDATAQPTPTPTSGSGSSTGGTPPGGGPPPEH